MLYELCVHDSGKILRCAVVAYRMIHTLSINAISYTHWVCFSLWMSDIKCDRHSAVTDSCRKCWFCHDLLFIYGQILLKYILKIEFGEYFNHKTPCLWAFWWNISGTYWEHLLSFLVRFSPYWPALIRFKFSVQRYINIWKSANKSNIFIFS